MGQRLVTTICLGGDDERVLNCYMHWSAYTRETLATALRFNESWKSYATRADLPMRDRILRCALDAWVGSGVVEEDLPRLGSYGFATDPATVNRAVDRTAGLIAVSKEGMDSNDGWVEGMLRIYVDGDGGLKFWTDVFDVDERGNPTDDEGDPVLAKAVADLINHEEVDAKAIEAMALASGKAFRDGTFKFDAGRGLMVYLVA